ncbi:MAG: ABC transporter permease [Synechococcales cyanobacterium RM1_1_8]|nr:ABC transporter permease [Synechococcales cyanobacterium RM1_1_8]
MASKLIENVTEIAADYVGNRNPQLLREWQGRLRWRNLLITLAISMAVQGLLLLQRLAQLPTRTNNEFYPGIEYCLKQVETGCQVGPDNVPRLDWPLVWADVFRDLSFVLVWVLLIGGVYLLAADLSKETRRGTLNFLRMSPQSSRQILLGKLLGVPVLPYLGTGIMLPLHLATGLMATYPLKILLGFYGLLGAIAFCFYAAAMWFALLTPGLQGFQTWLISGISIGLLSGGWSANQSNSSLDWFRLFHPLQLLAYWDVTGWSGRSVWLFSDGAALDGFRDLGWFFWPAGKGGDEYLFLALPNALLLGAWFWRVLERKFQTPAKTSLGKVESYGLTLFLSLLMMGFTVQSWDGYSELWSYPVSMAICAVILMFLLLPPRQAVLDWARYRHQRPQGQRSPLGDLLSHDGSPSVLAVAVNLAIITGVALVGIGFNHHGNLATGIATESLIGWFFAAASLLGCALAMQWVALANLLHGRWVTFGIVLAWVLGLPIVLGMLGLDSYNSPFRLLWLMTTFSYTALHGLGWGDTVGAIAAHLALISGLSFFLSRRLQYLGQSEWQALSASPTRRSLSQL